MENQENIMEHEEILNQDQFQLAHAPEEEKLHEDDDSDYTEEETEYADGKGTQLNEEFDFPEREDLEEDTESGEEESQ